MKCFLPLLLALAVTSLSSAQAAPIAVGSPAPDVTAPNQEGQAVHFPDIYAKGITLVYFYPKAGTPGCTAEACSLRDSYDKLQAQGLQIIGVSRDTVDAQKNFQSQYKLPFTLVADPGGSVAKAFGVPSMGILPFDSRQSFIVKDGKVAWSSLHAKTDGSAQEIQSALDKLKG